MRFSEVFLNFPYFVANDVSTYDARGALGSISISPPLLLFFKLL